MDLESVFDPMGYLTDDNLHTFIEYFGTCRDDVKPMVQQTLETYMGRTLPINKKIGDYFTRMVYKKPLQRTGS